MAAITTRAAKGAPLSHAEMDANFSNINADVDSRAPASHTHVATEVAETTGRKWLTDTERTKLAGIAAVAGYADATPYLLRGSVSGALWAGVTKGFSATQAQRIANLAALQAAVDYAATNRKFFELEPGDYGIEGTAGLVIPQTKNSGFEWQGTKGSHIRQYSNNCPVITIGDISATGLITEQAVVKGLRASYATDQSANTASTAVRIGQARNCTFAEWNVFADSLVNGWPVGTSIRAYRGVVMQSAAGSMSYFSNTMKDVMIGGAQRNLLAMGLDTSAGQDGSTLAGGGGTGNVFSNIYLANGVTGSPQPIADYALRLRGQADLYEGVLEQINIEWCTGNKLVFMETVRNAVFLSWHLEGCRLTGADPTVFNLSSSQINFKGINLLDLEVLSASATGTPSIFTTYAECSIAGTGLALNWSGSGKVNRNFQMAFMPSWSPTDQPPAYNIQGFATRDVTGGNSNFFAFDSNTPVANFPAPFKVDQYRWADALPEFKGVTSRLNLASTYYGVQGDATLIYPASMGAARTLTLAGTMKASGVLSSVPVPIGTIVTVRRAPGTVDANSLVVKNLTSGGTTLSTLTTADSVARHRFDGTNWIVVT